MGNLLNDIDLNKRKSGPKRRIEQVLAELSPEDAADLQTALDDHSVPQAAICRALHKRGIGLSQSVISNYRTGIR